MWKTISLSLLALTLKATAAIEPDHTKSDPDPLAHTS